MEFQRSFLFCVKMEEGDARELAAGAVGVCTPVKLLLTEKNTLND